MTDRQEMTWGEAYQKALDDTFYGYKGEKPSKEEFLDTFKTFYDDTVATNYITSYPYDPPSSRRAAIQRATVVYVDEIAPADSV